MCGAYFLHIKDVRSRPLRGFKLERSRLKDYQIKHLFLMCTGRRCGCCFRLSLSRFAYTSVTEARSQFHAEAVLRWFADD